MNFDDSGAAERSARGNLWICLALVLATLAVYSQVRHFDFVIFDDPAYVSNNRHLAGGMSLDGIKWAFTATEGSNWFPLTNLSFILQYWLSGIQSGWYHLTDLALHVLASVVLFAFLLRATGARWPSAFVAFLFALHPLHVESVAWVAERKDVLCAVFWFLTLWAWVYYAERPSGRRYLPALLLFAMGLMSKPMIVTLPFLLLLLDFWPLRRPFSRKLLFEKLPFLSLSAGSALIAYLAQRSSGAVQSLGDFPLGLRIENALVTWIVYIAKMFWPSRLAVFYPYPQQLPAWQVAAAGMALAGVSVLVLRAFRTRPWLAVGWFWYLGTLIPVIGLVQIGLQSRADRYMYVPMVGLAIMLSWGGADACRRWPPFKPWAAALASLWLAVLLPVTWFQVGYWKDSETLFRHAIDVTEANQQAHLMLGIALATVPARLPDAVAVLEAGLRIDPHEVRLQTYLGATLLATKNRANLPLALDHLRAALRIDPGYAAAHSYMSVALARTGHAEEAADEARAALRLNPDTLDGHQNLADALFMLGRWDEAIDQFHEALKINPDYAAAHNNLGLALTKIPGETFEALSEFEEAVRIQPDYRPALVNLGLGLSKIPGRLPEAIAYLGKAQKIQPDRELQKRLEQLEALEAQQRRGER